MPNMRSYGRDDLLNLEQRYPFFVGVDSDGCVFDTMEIKQKQCFHTLIISHWRLEAIEPYVRETAEFVNLYSKTRGRNRFPCLYDTFQLLRNRPEVAAAGVQVPPLTALRKFIDSGLPLGNPALEQAASESGNQELASVLEWSLAVNRKVEEVVTHVPPFKWVRESLNRICQTADAICVSQTPGEALLREWQQHDLIRYVSVIAGQELGTKNEHIALATQGRYTPQNMLIIGDAPGDRKAAQAANALFYPINPAHEEASWERFHAEAYGKFLAGTYAGDYETACIAEFEALLPEEPPWK